MMRWNDGVNQTRSADCRSPAYCALAASSQGPATHASAATSHTLPCATAGDEGGQTIEGRKHAGQWQLLSRPWTARMPGSAGQHHH